MKALVTSVLLLSLHLQDKFRLGSGSCKAEYQADIDAFYALSGASTSPSTATNLQGIPSENVEPNEWIEKRFQALDMQARYCWSRGSRYWETILHIPRYHLLFEGHEDPTCDGCFARFQAIWERLPNRIQGALCAPSVCSAEQVRRIVLPRFMARFLMAEFELPPPTEDQAEVEELSHWSQLRLDFVVAGLNSCGTTSLGKNLAQIEGISFTRDGEDDWLFKNDRLLPYRSEVEDFNFQWLSHLAAEPQMRGMRHPGLFGSHRIRLALASVPKLKALLVVCDPLSRFEKVWWMFHHCKPPGHRPPVPVKGVVRCFHSAKSALEEPELLRRWRISDHVASLQQLLGPRLRVVHQESLRRAPRDTFAKLSEYLGATGRPSDEMFFERYNHHGGHRSDLCHNESLVRDLKELLQPEYQAVEALLAVSGGGEALPEELLQQRTRCDRLEELSEIAVESGRSPPLPLVASDP